MEAQRNEKLTISNLSRLLELVGSKDSESIRFAITKLERLLSSAPVTGRVLESRKESDEFVIPFSSQENKEEIEECLDVLGIFPWIEEGQIIVENDSDLQKLGYAGIMSLKGVPEDVVPRELPLSRPIDLYQFPLTPTLEGKSLYPKNAEHQNQRGDKPKEQDFEESAGIDIEIAKLVDNFDQGILNDEDPEFRNVFGSIPNLSLFPQKYVWKKGICFDKRTGEEITPKMREEILTLAKEGDEAARRKIIELHTGLVLYKLAFIRKRFGGVEADDLFQAGLLGVLGAIEKYDPLDESGVSFAGYASIAIENGMRNLIAREGELVRIPQNIRDERRAFFLSLQATKRENPSLSEDDPIFQERFSDKLFATGLQFSPDQLKRRLHIGSTFIPLEDAEGADPSEVDMLGMPRMSGADQIEEAAIHGELREKVAEALAGISSLRMQIVLLARFGIIPEKTGPDLFAELSELIKLNPRFPENSKRIIDEVKSFDREKFHSAEFREKPYMERFLYALAGKVSEEELGSTENSYSEGASLDAISDLFGVTRERIRHIEAEGLRKLRYPALAKKIRPFLDNEE